jgi:hypothetical protein
MATTIVTLKDLEHLAERLLARARSACPTTHRPYRAIYFSRASS